MQNMLSFSLFDNHRTGIMLIAFAYLLCPTLYAGIIGAGLEYDMY